ncbi:hypothetical protein DOTSEDRAFT_73270 [Dothistroma septosporum NZE10]|uniref:Uncharacterized protein n=1 Tax=Dothistroma septosporum (strain NZE10 / CBS 128990) TaxID=675120 RepID=N1PJ17_DOTSN|nr:hypothetical protein DOTSEDRAFT_73270 [Dothistroma septosporum NZE10]
MSALAASARNTNKQSKSLRYNSTRCTRRSNLTTTMTMRSMGLRSKARVYDTILRGAHVGRTLR